MPPFPRSAVTALLALLLAVACGAPSGREPQAPGQETPAAGPGVAALAWPGDLLALDREGRVLRWGSDLSPQKPLKVPSRGLQAAALSPDGRFLALGFHDRRVEVHGLAAPSSPPLVLQGHRDGILALAFAPDSTLLASGADDRTGRLWHLPDGAPAGLLEGAEEALTALAFSASGKVLAGATWSGRIGLWEASGGPAREWREGPGGFIAALAFAPDGSLVAAAQEGTLVLWPLRGAARPLARHAPGLRSLALSPDGRTAAAGGGDGQVLLVSLEGGPPRSVPGHKRYVQALAWSRDGRLASGGQDGTLLVWDPSAETPSTPRPLQTP